MNKRYLDSLIIRVKSNYGYGRTFFDALADLGDWLIHRTS